MPILRPSRLRPGDRVRLVSPASTPERADVERVVANLIRLGLQPELGEHVFDRNGFLAGTDEHRLADLNDAFRDPGVRAVIATRGGKGAYRIADAIDFEAIQRDPKLLVGFSEITVLHLAILRECGVAGLHGAAWTVDRQGLASAESFERAIFSTSEVIIESVPSESTFSLTTAGPTPRLRPTPSAGALTVPDHASTAGRSGTVSGPLIGGNQDMVAVAAGWALPSLNGAILLLEAVNLRLGHIDRQLTMLQNAGALEGVVGVAIGQYTGCGPEATEPQDWDTIEILRDRLCRLNVPLLGGLPIGHGNHPLAVPIGTNATLDVVNRTLRVDAAVS